MAKAGLLVMLVFAALFMAANLSAGSPAVNNLAGEARDDQ